MSLRNPPPGLHVSGTIFFKDQLSTGCPQDKGDSMPWSLSREFKSVQLCWNHLLGTVLHSFPAVARWTSVVHWLARLGLCWNSQVTNTCQIVPGHILQMHTKWYGILFIRVVLHIWVANDWVGLSIIWMDICGWTEKISCPWGIHPPGSMSQAPFFSKTNCPQDVHRTKGTACPEVFPESSNLYNYVEIICLALCCILFQQSLAELLLCIDLRDWGCAGTVKSRTYVK